MNSANCRQHYNRSALNFFFLKLLIATLLVLPMEVAVSIEVDVSSTILNKLLADDGSAIDDFGYSVSISGDTAIIGAFGDNDNDNGLGLYLCS